MSDKAVTHQFKNCTIDLRGAGYACVSRGDEFEIGHTGEGDRVLIYGDTLDFTGLHILGPVALADRIKSAVALECYAMTTERDALRGELARLTAERDSALAGAVKVRPLVWSDGYRPVASPQSYQIWPDNGGSGAPDDPIETFDGYMLYSPTMMALGVHPTPEAAKAAAQADYEARILAAIQPAPEARQADLSTAARDVLAERARQISAEGWTPEHDDQHVDGEMAQASGCYALNAAGWKTEALRGCWPIKWMAAWFKPTTPRRDLVKAGALIIAEIERLDRATPPADLAAKIGGEA